MIFPVPVVGVSTRHMSPIQTIGLPHFFEFLLLSLFSLSTFLGISKLSPSACLKFTKKNARHDLDKIECTESHKPKLKLDRYETQIRQKEEISSAQSLIHHRGLPVRL